VERGRRIELLALAWKAKVLPLYEPRGNWLRRLDSNQRFLAYETKRMTTSIHRYTIYATFGTSNRDRTGTHMAADFKSAGSTNSPILAYPF
jgi:hypothetical protein